MLGLGTVLYVALLLVNSIAILNEERFLSRSEWYLNAYKQLAGQQILAHCMDLMVRLVNRV